MAEQIKSCKDVEGIEDLGKLVDNSQNALDIKKLVDKLRDGNPDLKFDGEQVETILAKLGEQQNAYYVADLVNALKKANQDLEFTEEHVKTILEKLKKDQNASNIAILVTALKESGVVITEEHVKTILAKLGDQQNVDDMARLVKALKDSGVNLQEHVKTILAKLQENRDASNMADLVKALKENNPDLKFTEKHVETILAKLGDQQHVDDMARLVKALKENNPDLKFTEEHVKTILAKLEKNTAVVPMIKLAIELKKNNHELSFNTIDNEYSWIKSLDNDGVSTKEDKNVNENIIIINEENNKNIEGEPNKRVLANAIMNYFKYELQNLEQHPNQIDSKKEVWLQIADDLKKEKILDKYGAAQFKTKVRDIHDLSLLATFVQWLGCVLSAFLVVPVFFPSVYNRIIHPENTRKLERFRDKKDELIAPLQGFVDSKQDDDHEIN